jgi:hypothetical protein
MRKLVLTGSLVSLVATVGYAYNITHPNLKDAYGLADQAVRHIQEAQQANKQVAFGGHAEKAIDLFQKAQAELIEADKYNDAHQPKK